VKPRRRTITLFGNFGGGNFGNEATLLAMIEGLHRFTPDADLRCICTVPEKVVANYKIPAISSRADVLKPWAGRGRLISVARRVLLGIPSELYRWLWGFRMLWGTHAVVVPGTGLLTDAHTFLSWGT
jgi:polysaccharide pyruvyl transferase WcaK-like protein